MPENIYIYFFGGRGVSGLLKMKVINDAKKKILLEEENPGMQSIQQ